MQLEQLQQLELSPLEDAKLTEMIDALGTLIEGKEIKHLNVEQIVRVVKDNKKSHETRMAQEKIKAQVTADAGEATRKRLQRSQEVPQISVLVEKANDEELRRRAVIEIESRRRREAADKEKKAAKRKFDKAYAVTKAAREKAEKERRRLAQAIITNKRPVKRNYAPELGAAIRFFEDVVTKSQSHQVEIDKYQSTYTPEQRAALARAMDDAALACRP